MVYESLGALVCACAMMFQCVLSLIFFVLFPKTGTLGADAASLKRWVDHMTNRLTSALEETLVSQDVIKKNVQALHQVIGWDASIGRSVPSAPLAAGTWDEQVETCSTLFQMFGLPSHVAQEWHKELSHDLHGTDPPLIDDLRGLLQKCHDFNMRVAICTSDDRVPTDAALRNWDIADLVNVRSEQTKFLREVVVLPVCKAPGLIIALCLFLSSIQFAVMKLWRPNRVPCL